MGKQITFLYGIDSPDEESTRGFNRPLGYNFFNMEASRWEPSSHGIDSRLSEHRIYEVELDHFPVSYIFCRDDNKFYPGNSGLPVFEMKYLETTHCAQPFFEDWFGSSDSCFYIMFTSNDLRAAGIKVPEDHTGYRFDPSSVRFLFSEEPVGHGWDPFFRQWIPFCCTSKELFFDWASFPDGMSTNVCSSKYRTPNEAISSRTDCPLVNLFSNRGGPYCCQECYCYDGCKRYYPPEEAKHHKWISENIRVCDIAHFKQRCWLDVNNYKLILKNYG